jgi:2-amino-4-hydroxy-6-hydroxymethyldihydropteridine diphosphokinase
LNDPILVLHLGSNVGNRLLYLNNALKALEAKIGKPLKISGIYETKAWGVTDQPDFLNIAVIYKTHISPAEVLQLIQKIEVMTGRIKRKHWHEREIDIDIVLFGNLVIEEPNLKIPHPRMHHRNFVLVPLNEICPELIHPTLNRSVAELLEQCTDNLYVEKWKND